MAAAAREFFTVDLRGLRAALAVRAARDNITESDVLRSALAAALGTDRAALASPIAATGLRSPSASHVKLSVRLVRRAADRLDQDVRAAGLSRGAYLARLIQGAPPVLSSTDRIVMCAALNSSSEELALMSRDIHHLTSLLRRGSVEAARAYTARHESLNRDVRAHLALAARVLVDLTAMR